MHKKDVLKLIFKMCEEERYDFTKLLFTFYLIYRYTNISVRLFSLRLYIVTLYISLYIFIGLQYQKREIV